MIENTHTILSVAVIVSTVYFIFRNRIDFMLLAFASNFVYHMHIIFGRIETGAYNFDPSPESMHLLTIVFLVLVLVTIITDKIYYGVGGRNVVGYARHYRLYYDPIMKTMTLLSLLLTLLLIITNYNILFLGKAAMKQQAMPYIFIAATMMSAVSYLYFIYTRNIKMLYVSFLPIIFYVFIGTRAIAVVVIVSSLIIWFFNEKLLSKIGLKILIYVCFLVIFFVIYKFSYIGIKSGDWSSITSFTDLDNMQYIIWQFYSAEWGQISSNLSLVAEQDLTDRYNFFHTIIESTPLVNKLFEIDTVPSRFSATISLYANPGYSYGLGGTFWGEMYQASGSYISVAISAVVIFIIISFMNYSIYKGIAWSPIILYLVGFMSFYLPRNDLQMLIASFKNVFIVIVSTAIVILILKGKLKCSKSVANIFLHR